MNYHYYIICQHSFEYKIYVSIMKQFGSSLKMRLFWSFWSRYRQDHLLIRFLKVSANIRIMVKQSASWSSSVPFLTPETQCASAYCQLLHTTITRSCTTVRFKQTVSPGSSNYTTIASVGPRSNHSGVESLPKASPLRCLCLSFTDLFLSPPPLFHLFSPWIYLIPSSQLYS